MITLVGMWKKIFLNKNKKGSEETSWDLFQIVQRRDYGVSEPLDPCEYSCTLRGCCSITKPWPTLCDPMDGGVQACEAFLSFTISLSLFRLMVHWVDDAIQPSHPLLPPSPTAFNLSQHQGLIQWISSLFHVAKELEFQLRHQSFQWIFKVDFL